MLLSYTRDIFNITGINAIFNITHIIKITLDIAYVTVLDDTHTSLTSLKIENFIDLGLDLDTELPESPPE